MLKLTTVLLSAVALSCSCSPGRTETRYVSLDGGDEAPYTSPETASRSIQRAVDASGPGDTIRIAAADYQEHIVMGRGLTLLGSGRDQTRLWGSIRAGIDAHLTGLGIHQERGQGDPSFAAVAVRGPRTGGLTVADCLISGTFKTGIYCDMQGGSIFIVDCDVRGIRTTESAHAIEVETLGPPIPCVIDKCAITDNLRGVTTGSNAQLWLSRSVLTLNDLSALFLFGPAVVDACSVDSNGEGVVANGWEQLVRIQSSTLCRNAEAGLRCGDGALVKLVGCTIVENGTGVFFGNEGSGTARRCIIWGNHSANVQMAGRLSYFHAQDSNVGGYCDGPGLCPGWGNIEGDPLFVDPAHGNYRLRPESPCIDRRRKGALDWEFGQGFDRDGKPRLAYGGGVDGPAVDMGAYEYRINRIDPGPAEGQLTVTWGWSSLGRDGYSVYYSDDLVRWRLADSTVSSAGWTTSWIDDGSKTGVPPSLVPRRFYRILENP